MRRSRSLIALAAAAGVGVCGVASDARTPVPQSRSVVPPPPDIYDPFPGPFLSSVDEYGSIKDVGVVGNAIRSWAGPKLSAFSVCFQPVSKAAGRSIAFTALKQVSDELKKRGAAVVVITGPLFCPSPPAASMAGKPYVEITGVIRSVD